LKRLAGLLKFTLKTKAGKTTLCELAVATAQKESTVRLGLVCLSQQGQLTAEILRDGQINLTANGSVDSVAAEETASQLADNLNESRAYRKHFQKQTKLDL
jgi:hypothetical protein